MNNLVINIKNEFPSLTSTNKQTFMVNSKNFIDSMIKSPNIGEFLSNFKKNDKCEKCSQVLENWPHKTKHALFIDVAELKVINIPVKICPTCKYLDYPDVIKYGLLCIHNKVLISYRMLMELLDPLVIGGSLIDFIMAKVHNNGLSEGLEYDFLNTNLVNIAKIVEGTGIAVLSLLVQDEDLNSVICYYCGSCPKCVNSDGNSKDTVAVDTSYMVYEEKGKSCIEVGGLVDGWMDFFFCSLL